MSCGWPGRSRTRRWSRKKKRKPTMEIYRINLNEPARARPRKVYARNPKKTFEDPVFKASEVTFYPPDYDRAQSVVAVKKENGRILREGYIENIRYMTVDGKDLVEFTCSPAAESTAASLFSVLVEAGCVEKLTQKRTIKQENRV